MANPVLIQNIRAVRDNLLSQYPELQEDDQALADTMEGETDYVELVARAIEREAEAKSMTEAIAARIAELNERKQRLARKAKMEREFAQRVMHAAGVKKVVLPEATVGIKVTPPGLIITDEKAAEKAGFVRLISEIDKDKIKKAIKNGACFDWARMGAPGETLSISRK